MKIANGRQLFPGLRDLIPLDLAHRTAGSKLSAFFLRALWDVLAVIMRSGVVNLFYLQGSQSYRTRVVDKQVP